MKQSIRPIMMVMSFFIAAGILAAAPIPVAAAPKGCSYKKTLQQGGYIFDVSSRPADGCAVQIVEVVVRKGTKALVRFKTDVDYLVESAWAVDLDNDGKPEVAVASKSLKPGERGTFDVYWLDGKFIRRAAMQEHEEGIGYQGHDAFHLRGRKIERTFPVYLENDPEKRPSGGTRTLQYEFNNGKLELNIKSDSLTAAAAIEPAPAASPVPAQPEQEKKEAAPAALAQPEPAPTSGLRRKVIAKSIVDQTNETTGVPVKTETETIKPVTETKAIEPAVVAVAEPAPAAISRKKSKKIAKTSSNGTVSEPVKAIPEAVKPAEPAIPQPIDPAAVISAEPAPIAAATNKNEGLVRTTSEATANEQVKAEPQAVKPAPEPATPQATEPIAVVAAEPPVVVTKKRNKRVAMTASDATASEPVKAEPEAVKPAPEPATPRATEPVVVATAPDKAITAEPTQVTASENRQTAVATNKTIVRKIVTGSSYIEIQANTSISNYKIIELDKPARIAIDMPGAESGITSKSVAIGRHGISKARLGTASGRLRVVLDSMKAAAFPSYTVTADENNLRVVFSAAKPAVAPSAAESTVRAEQRVIEPIPAKTASKTSGRPVISDIVGGTDFIDVLAGSPIKKFKLIKLDKPARLAIDIPLATSSLARKTIILGNGGIEKARIGNGPTYLRIVLDSTLPELPAHNIVTTENGLRINLQK